MATTPEINQKLAKALAYFVLTYRSALNDLLLRYGVNISDLSPLQALQNTERLVQTQKGFAKDLLLTMGANFKSFRNEAGADSGGGGLDFGSLFGGFGSIFSGTGAIMNGVTGIIDATSDSGKKVRETLAQAELIKAQAMMNASQNATSRSIGQPVNIKTVMIVGGVALLVIAGIITTVVIVRKNKKSKGK